MSSLRHHGDVDAEPGLLDFAVNVHGAAPPAWLVERLAARLPELARYPSAADERRAREAVAARHGRSPDEVLLLAGAAEGFAMLPNLAPRHAAVLHPSFTEPEIALREAGIRVSQVILEPPYELVDVPASADLVVVGNPTNPTSVLHDPERLRAPGRILVVDEAFMDAVPGERASIANRSLPDVVVLRSLTKSWALAGLRCGYALGAPDVLARLTVGRAHWPLGTLQLEAIAACSEPAAVAQVAKLAGELDTHRDAMLAMLTDSGFAVHTPATAPFLLVTVDDGELMRKRLREQGIAVRRGDTFPGLGPDHIRVAVREPVTARRLVDAMIEARS